MPEPNLPDQESAEILALSGLAWLASAPERLNAFMDLTGISKDELQLGAATPHVQSSILGHFLQDETVLLMFAADTGISPTDIAPAHHVLQNAS